MDRILWRRCAAATLVGVLAFAAPGCAAQGGDGGGDPSPAAAKVKPKENGVSKVEKRVPIPHASHTRRSAELKKGVRRVAQKGRDGVRLKVWRVTTKNGKTVARKLVGTEVLRKPVPRIVVVGTRVAAPKPAQSGCHPSYSPCVPMSSDVDCGNGSGDGPSYVAGPVKVLGSDPYDLDSDGDGWGCVS